MNNQGVFGKKENALAEETSCLSLPVMHPSSNPSKQSSDLLFFGTAHTCPHACGFRAPIRGDMQQHPRFRVSSKWDSSNMSPVFQAPGGGDTQQRPCFRVSSERDFSNMSPLQLNDSPYTVYLEPDNA
ncbi:hypothetical protein K7X08_019318 [Anisodus acutangulus]|uniref:Uncharacterized protein n=1 Tax=Anisodus acutangulus TaxID=402998 RepID=A0A9Q1MRC3_9SOLA|nr:hypothetical protein K7X08_019318 [Anisodus acutangulus]